MHNDDSDAATAASDAPSVRDDSADMRYAEPGAESGLPARESIGPSEHDVGAVSQGGCTAVQDPAVIYTGDTDSAERHSEAMHDRMLLLRDENRRMKRENGELRMILEKMMQQQKAKPQRSLSRAAPVKTSSTQTTLDCAMEQLGSPQPIAYDSSMVSKLCELRARDAALHRDVVEDLKSQIAHLLDLVAVTGEQPLWQSCGPSPPPPQPPPPPRIIETIEETHS